MGNRVKRQLSRGRWDAVTARNRLQEIKQENANAMAQGIAALLEPLMIREIERAVREELDRREAANATEPPN